MTQPFDQKASTLAGHLTPAGMQSVNILQWRRLFFASVAALTYAALAFGIYNGLGLGHGRWPVAELSIFALCLIGMPWSVIGFWNAVIGFWLLQVHRDGLMEAVPFWAAVDENRPITLRTAVLMTIRNEDPARAMMRLAAVRESLDATGQGSVFDYFVLSDTSDAGIAKQEEALCADWRARYGEDARLIYRRREQNEGFKAGNIRDFLDRYAEPYELMLPLDADSVMSGDFIVKLACVMGAYPKLGILQTLIVGTPSPSAFTRMFQFGMRHGMRSYTMGSVWWTGDCGPFWGHNALVRVKPFREHCALPLLPGDPPLGGHVLSHDQIEAAYMRRGGFEVRVVPVEGCSYEDNPPTLLDFTKRDLRWCQGNMQYWRFLFEPGFAGLSRVQIGLAILMYLGGMAWTAVVVLAAAGALRGGFEGVNAKLLESVTVILFIMGLTPKLAGLADVCLTRGGTARYGGTLRFIAGAVVETLFSMLLAPGITFRSVIFMFGLAFGRTVTWSGQERDARNLNWQTAARGLWLEPLLGVVLFAIVATVARGTLLYASPLFLGLMLSIPLAVLSASPIVGGMFVRAKLCGIPEEFAPVEILQALDKATHSRVSEVASTLDPAARDEKAEISDAA